MAAKSAIFQKQISTFSFPPQYSKIIKLCNPTCIYSPKLSVRRVRRLEPKRNPMGWASCNIAGVKGVEATFNQDLTHKRSDFRMDKLSLADLEYTLNHLSRWLVIALLGGVLIYRHDSKALWAASGSVVSAAISNILKKILNHDRPVPSLSSDSGMPSSHAQAIFFIIIFTLVSMFELLGSNAFTISFCGLILACGSYLSWLRVRQQYHTINQVLVGAILGTIISIMWFWSWEAVVHEAFITHLWVRLVVALGASMYSTGLLLYIVRNLNNFRDFYT